MRVEKERQLCRRQRAEGKNYDGGLLTHHK